MIRKTSQTLTGVMAALFLGLNTALCGLAMAPFALIKALAPSKRFRRLLTKPVIFLGNIWMGGNAWFLDLLGLLRFRISGSLPTERNATYLIWANHQSWVDIIVIQSVLLRKVPFVRFFLKIELAWIPVLNFAWWALDFPFMKRYSREAIARDPSKKGADLRTTQKACRKFRGQPVSILNFLEGTRFTPAKRDAQASPYRFLLPPKSGGIAAVLAGMGDQFRSLIDMTIVYPKGPGSFWDFLCGRVGEVLVHVEERPIPALLAGTSRADDEGFRRETQAWIQGLWAEKEMMIGKLLSGR